MVNVDRACGLLQAYQAITFLSQIIEYRRQRTVGFDSNRVGSVASNAAIEFALAGTENPFDAARCT